MGCLSRLCGCHGTLRQPCRGLLAGPKAHPQSQLPARAPARVPAGAVCVCVCVWLCVAHLSMCSAPILTYEYFDDSSLFFSSAFALLAPLSPFLLPPPSFPTHPSPRTQPTHAYTHPLWTSRERRGKSASHPTPLSRGRSTSPAHRTNTSPCATCSSRSLSSATAWLRFSSRPRSMGTGGWKGRRIVC